MFEKKLWAGALCRCERNAGLISREVSRGDRNGAEFATKVISPRLKDMSENEIATLALDICFTIHRRYGPGLFESLYEEIFCFEWGKTGIPFKRQQGIAVIHEEIKMDIGFRADVILDNKVILEIKSIEQLQEIHFKQVTTYLKLTNLKLGLLVNFNVVFLKDGIKRVANKL